VAIHIAPQVGRAWQSARLTRAGAAWDWANAGDRFEVHAGSDFVGVSKVFFADHHGEVCRHSDDNSGSVRLCRAGSRNCTLRLGCPLPADVAAAWPRAHATRNSRRARTWIRDEVIEGLVAGQHLQPLSTTRRKRQRVMRCEWPTRRILIRPGIRSRTGSVSGPFVLRPERERTVLPASVMRVVDAAQIDEAGLASPT